MTNYTSKNCGRKRGERERESEKKLIIQDCLNDKKNVARIEANEE